MTFFFSSSNLSNYADDNTLYTSGDNLKEIKEVLLNDLNKVTEWFFKNYIVVNAGKCNFMCLGKNTENETFTLKDSIMNNSKEEKILRVVIVNRLMQKNSSKISRFVKNIKRT